MRRKFSYYANIAAIIRELITFPVSLRELEKKTGIAYETLRPMINALRKEQVVHIAMWKVDSMNRSSIACYSLGFGVDAPKRQPKTGAQRSMKYKNKMRDRLDPMKTIRTNKTNAIDEAMRYWI
jgi:RimJ/RimL family protein N-acetyltransferase